VCCNSAGTLQESDMRDLDLFALAADSKSLARGRSKQASSTRGTEHYIYRKQRAVPSSIQRVGTIRCRKSHAPRNLCVYSERRFTRETVAQGLGFRDAACRSGYSRGRPLHRASSRRSCSGFCLRPFFSRWKRQVEDRGTVCGTIFRYWHAQPLTDHRGMTFQTMHPHTPLNPTPYTPNPNPTP